MSDKLANIQRDISEYVKRGGRDAFAFSLTYSPKYDDVPGEEIERLIGKELIRKRSR